MLDETVFSDHYLGPEHTPSWTKLFTVPKFGIGSSRKTKKSVVATNTHMFTFFGGGGKADKLERVT